jgi:membrane-associated phospholipid phosphatase
MWRTWVLASGGQYRPSAPPAYRSPAWEAELAGVQEAVTRRTPAQEAAVQFWAGGPGTATPAGMWIEIARDLIVRDGLDALHAARVLALISVAMADGFICCWDAKYTYWTERPITADPSLDVLIPTPPFPSYTSGHSTISTAAATVLGHLFPADEDALLERADEAKRSRLWAGIHFPIDTEMGALGGGIIGRLVVARARDDGAE